MLRTVAKPAIYHRLLLFRINKPGSADTLADESSEDRADDKEGTGSCPSWPAGGDSEPELYCMEESCPHLGAPLSHAELEIDDIEDTRAIGELGGCGVDLTPVCPWHQYDFGGYSRELCAIMTNPQTYATDPAVRTRHLAEDMKLTM